MRCPYSPCLPWHASLCLSALGLPTGGAQAQGSGPQACRPCAHLLTSNDFIRKCSPLGVNHLYRGTTRGEAAIRAGVNIGGAYLPAPNRQGGFSPADPTPSWSAGRYAAWVRLRAIQSFVFHRLAVAASPFVRRNIPRRVQRSRRLSQPPHAALSSHLTFPVRRRGAVLSIDLAFRCLRCSQFARHCAVHGRAPPPSTALVASSAGCRRPTSRLQARSSAMWIRVRRSRSGCPAQAKKAEWTRIGDEALVLGLAHQGSTALAPADRSTITQDPEPAPPNRPEPCSARRWRRRSSMETANRARLYSADC